MKRIELAIKPYNELWINCVSNNMLSILSAHNEVWTYLPCFSQAYYAKRLLIPEKSGQDVIQEYLNEGWLTLQVLYNLPELDQFFHVEHLWPNSEDEAENLIKQKLSEGCYVSLELDRFYFSGGIEYKKKTLIHPTLIYGYDEAKQSFLLLEDCVQLGHLEEYNLSYTDFNLAFQNMNNGTNEENVILHILKLKPFEESKTLFKDLKKLTVDNLNVYLSNVRKDYDEIYYDEYGIGAIQCYAENVDEIVFAAKDKEHLYHICKMPFNLQKRNFLLVELLYEYNVIDQQEKDMLQKKYQDLSNSWQAYKNKVLYYVESSRPVTYNTDFKERLNKLYATERETAELFLECLKK
nr:hypothetical protein [Paenibacillus xylanexedens]